MDLQFGLRWSGPTAYPIVTHVHAPQVLMPYAFSLSLYKGSTVTCNKIIFSDHIISQMFRRDISLEEVKLILNTGEVIREYSDDKPYPSFLILGFIDHRPLHLLVARDTDTGNCIMVTAYEPDRNIWSSDFKTKKR